MPPKEKQPGVCMLHPYMDDRLDTMEKKLDKILEYVAGQEALEEEANKSLRLKYTLYGALAGGAVSFVFVLIFRVLEIYTFL